MLLYVHIPFCDSKCHYCSFNSFVNNHDKIEAYFGALCLQLADALTYLKGRKLTSVYIGGGTPSAVKAKYYDKLFEMVEPHLEKKCEITVEANPNSASKTWQETMHGLGVNRISFGVQSFNTEKLHYLNRAHTAQTAIEAIETAYTIGLSNISLDLIYATQHDSLQLLESDISQAAILPISHISAYALTIENGTHFATHNIVSQESEEMARFVCSLINDRGFEQYEISSFGKQKSRHNLGYWAHEEYFGVGCGAVGYYEGTRFYPHRDLESYITTPLVSETEILTEEEIAFEKLFLGLRSCIGVDMSSFTSMQKEKVGELCSENRVEIKQNRLYNRDYLLSDEIALYLSKT